MVDAAILIDAEFGLIAVEHEAISVCDMFSACNVSYVASAISASSPSAAFDAERTARMVAGNRRSQQTRMIFSSRVAPARRISARRWLGRCPPSGTVESNLSTRVHSLSANFSIMAAFNLLYGTFCGGEMMTSTTWSNNCGVSEATTASKRTVSSVMPCKRNQDSSRINQYSTL